MGWVIRAHQQWGPAVGCSLCQYSKYLEEERSQLLALHEQVDILFGKLTAPVRINGNLAQKLLNWSSTDGASGLKGEPCREGISGNDSSKSCHEGGGHGELHFERWWLSEDEVVGWSDEMDTVGEPACYIYWRDERY